VTIRSNQLDVVENAASNEMTNDMVFRIIAMKSQLFYEVDFGDGTFSNDMLPEDIIVNIV
jgi:hypothetical protein